MGRIFNIDGPFVNFMNKLADLVWLNILYIICCIPIITIGASTTALYYVTLKMARNEEAYITRSFFKSFKLNFKQSTLIWIIDVILGIVIFMDFSIINGRVTDAVQLSSAVKNVMNIMLVLVSGIYVFTSVFVYPLAAKFENSTNNMIKNAFILSCKHFPATIVEIASIFVFTLLVVLVPACFVITILIMFSLIAYISSIMYVKVFDHYIPVVVSEDVESEATEADVSMEQLQKNGEE